MIQHSDEDFARAFESLGLKQDEFFASLGRHYSRSPLKEIVLTTVLTLSQFPDWLGKIAAQRRVSLVDCLELPLLSPEAKALIAHAAYCDDKASTRNRDIIESDIRAGQAPDLLSSLGMRRRRPLYNPEKIAILSTLAIQTNCFAKFAPPPRPAETLLSQLLEEAQAHPELGARLALLILEQAATDPKVAARFRQIIGDAVRRNGETFLPLPG